jgi:hypothetical protein
VAWRTEELRVTESRHHAVLLASKPVGPLSGGVKHAKDFNGICANSIGNDEGSVAKDELAGPRNSARAAHSGILSEQVYGLENFLHGAVCHGCVVFRDIVRFFFEVG